MAGRKPSFKSPVPIKAREYAATTEELDQLLDQVVDYFADASVDYRQVIGGSGAISASGN